MLFLKLYLSFINRGLIMRGYGSFVFPLLYSALRGGENLIIMIFNGNKLGER